MVLVDEAIKALPHPQDIVSLHEPHVSPPGFVASKPLVFLENRWQAPVLQLPQTANQATGSMLSAFAVDQDWVVSHIN